MELKKSLSKFTDRELLELMLCNQVQLERRIDRVENYLHKQADKEAQSSGLKNEYHTAPHDQDGRKNNYTYAQNFKELIEQARKTKDQINQLLKKEDSEISW